MAGEQGLPPSSPPPSDARNTSASVPCYPRNVSNHWNSGSFIRGRRAPVRSSWNGANRAVPRAGSRRLSGRRIGVVLAAAACAGMAIGLSIRTDPSAAPSTTLADSQLRVQGAPAVESAADRAWRQNRPSPVETRGSNGAQRAFGLCHSGGGSDCVVDGDTFYLGGDKVRIAGIDAPETHPSRCVREAELGEAATASLRAMLGSGPITLSAIDRDRDHYGRLLRNVAVDGRDVGEALIAQGVARAYDGGRRPWC